jgi:hypothetical protein
MAKTLEELKAENAAEEQAQAQPEAIEAPEATDELEAVEPEAEGQTEEAGDAETVEAWEAEDDPASKDGDKKFSDSDIAAVRRKLKARLNEKDEELERLKAEVQALKQGTQRPAQEAGKVPTLEDYDYDQGKYAAAMQAWVIGQVANVTKTQETQSRQAQQLQALQSQVESHYERAAKLVKERTIDPDLYGAADKSFRQTIEAALPGQGDLVSDQLIARLGEGSEKVTFYLGRNATEREILKAKLMEDPSGLSASMHLGRLLAKVSMPVQKTTKAPAPAARAEGGESSSANATNLKRKYEKATDVQDRIDIKRQAKRAGFDVSNW